MKTEAAVAFIVAAVTSAMIWGASPWLTGKREPWDAAALFYVVALLFAGGISGALAPKPLWAHYVGSIVGQLSYEIFFLKTGPLFVLGAMFLLGYCLLFVLAASLTSYIVRRFSKVDKSYSK